MFGGQFSINFVRLKRILMENFFCESGRISHRLKPCNVTYFSVSPFPSFMIETIVVFYRKSLTLLCYELKKISLISIDKNNAGIKFSEHFAYKDYFCIKIVFFHYTIQTQSVEYEGVLLISKQNIPAVYFQRMRQITRHETVMKIQEI